MLVIGNGSSIALSKEIGIGDSVDLTNLFSKGADVKWPVDGKPGFLSHKNTPALWRLGARPYSTSQESNSIIENIITCSNVFASMPRSDGRSVDSEYIRAYNELSKYLRHLFAHYDSLFCAMTDPDKLLWNKWCLLNFVQKIYLSKNISEIDIISYNYDVLLERGLNAKSIPFTLDNSTKKKKEKIRIHKPHGSISYIPRGRQMDPLRFQIPTTLEPNALSLAKYRVSYSDLDMPVIKEAIIPPAGESSRYNFKWANEIQSEIKRRLKCYNESDALIFCGLSYWSVDRLEIDEIIKGFNSKGQVFSVNPNPTPSFIAVLTTVFKNVIHFNNATQLDKTI